MSSSSTNSSSQESNLVLAIRQRRNENEILKLVDGASNVNITDEYGKTALFHAIHSSNYKSVVDTLIQAGADVNVTDSDGKTALFYAVREKNNESVVRALIDAHVVFDITDKDGKTALFYAVQQEDNKRVVQALTDAGADVNITDKDGKTALFHALEQKNSQNVVQVLIKGGADVNIADKNGNNALLHALEKDCFESLILSLIDACADVNVLNNFQQSALNFAVRRRDNEYVVRALIKAGAEVNQTVVNSSTAMFFAVSESSNGVVRALIDAGADVNRTNEDGQTALFNTVFERNNESMIYTLIDAGAKVNVVDKHGDTAFSYALIRGNTDIERTLLALIARGANVNISKDGRSALLWAIERRHKENVVRAIIKAGADVNKTDNDNKTPLYYAVLWNRNEGVISALIDAGADVNLIYDGGKTILFYAVEKYNNEGVVRSLIDAGADLNISSSDGKTILFYAVQHYYNENVVQMLIDAGADIKVTDMNDQTILIHVVQVRYDSDENEGQKARLLIDLGAEVNNRDKLGKTALLYAAQSNNVNLVRVLINADADVHATDSDGQTALLYAVQQNDNENVVRALIDAKADVNTADKYGYTALFHAVQQRNNAENVVKALIAANANVNAIINDVQTALFYAVQKQNDEGVVRALTKAGADVSITDKYGKTALFYAVQMTWRGEGVVRALIEANEDILTVKDIYGRTALFYINLGSSKAAIEYLLEKGGLKCLRLKDNCNVDILTFAIENYISETGMHDPFKGGMLDNLIKQGIIKCESVAKVVINIMFRKYVAEVLNSSNIETSSYSLRNFEGLSCLYKENVDYNVWERTKKMDSFLAVLREDFRGTSKALELLVELGADPDSADSDGNTALHLTARSPLMGASEETVMDLCKQLKKLEVRFNARNHENQTPLLFCLSQITGNNSQSPIKTVVKVCRFLVKNGSNIEEISRTGEAVFHFMMKLFQVSLKLYDKTAKQEVLNYLIELLQLFVHTESAKVAVIKSDVHLNTPLHLWASLTLTSLQHYTTQLTDDHTFQSILKLILDSLLKCGARVNARNHNDETPLHLCKTWFAIQMLINAGANVNDMDLSRRSALLVAAKNKLFLENPDCFYPDVSEEPKLFWKNALEMGFDPLTADKQGESVLGILVASENFILAKSLVDVACEENYIRSEEVTSSLLNAICKDKSTRTHWKTDLVQDILKSNKSAISAATALQFCCKNVMEANVLSIEEQDMAVSMEVEVGENPNDDEPSRPKKRRVVVNEVVEEDEKLFNDPSLVHLEIIKVLRWFEAAGNEACEEAAMKYPPLKPFLTSKVNIDEIPKLIPWTSVSKRYEDKLAKVSRRQEHKMIDQYHYHKDHVGSGSFGHIFVGINDKDGREVAIKRIENVRIQRAEDKREIESLAALAYCEQVVGYLNFFKRENFSYIFLELMEGNLEEYLSDCIFDARESPKLCQDVVKGLRFLHRNQFLHRDLKAQNILYKTHPQLCLKIADFGLSRRMNSTSTTVYGTNVGTRCWIAPEVLKGSKDHSMAFDMFSCGLLLHFILSVQKHPFSPADVRNKSESQVANETEANIMRNKMEGWDNSISPEANHLIKWMLKSNEKERATAEEALEHPFCYSSKKKIDFLEAVGNQKEFECPRKMRGWPLTAVENDIEKEFPIIVRHGMWNDPNYHRMHAIYTEMTKKRKSYDTKSAVELVRFIRNAYAHVSEDTRPTPIRKMLLEDFLFLEYFPNLVMEVYKAVTTHGWHQSRDEIKYVMEN